MCSACSSSLPETATSATGAPEPGELTYVVAGMTCGHCKRAITEEVSRLVGVGSVEVDLESKLVRVHGERLEDAAVRAAIDEAGYGAVPA